jgi:hypothetical protein
MYVYIVLGMVCSKWNGSQGLENNILLTFQSTIVEGAN